MKNHLLGFFLFAGMTTLIAQPKWGSEWKFFTSTYVFDTEYDDNQKLSTDFVRDMAVDAKGDVWFASGNSLIQYKDKKYTFFKTKSYGDPKYVNAIAFDSQDVLYVGTNKGLYKFSNNEFTYVDVPGVGNVADIAINKKDQIYVSGFNNDALNPVGAGLSVFDGSEWKNYNTKNSDLPYRFVEDMAFDKEGSVWMSMGLEDRGVAKFDGSAWTFFNMNNSGLKSNKVRDIEFDSKNNAWFCTPKGLTKYDGTDWYTYGLKDLLYGTMFSNLTKFVDLPDLMSVAIDENDVVWIGTEGEGVIRIQGKGKTQMNVENSPVTSNYIRKIYVDKQNRKWFLTGMIAENWGDRFFKDMNDSRGSFKGAFMYQDPNYENFPDWKILNTFTSDLPGNHFYRVNKTSDGAMWFASAGYGIAEYNNEKWKTYRDPNSGLKGELLNCIYVNDAGECYGGAQLNGLYKKEGDVLVPKPKESFGYGNKNIKDVFIDDEGFVWIAHIAGVDRCKDGKCESFDKKSGLLSNNVFFFKTDSKNRVWVTNTKGVSIYDHGKWSSYTKKENGLEGYVYEIVEDSEGTFWAGTGKGLYKLEGDQWSKIEAEGEGVPKYMAVECMAIDNSGKLWIGGQTNGVFTYDGSEWEHFDWENSGVIFGKVWDIEVANTGEVWISIEKGSGVASSNSYTAGSTPATGPDPGYEIKKEIKEFDPSGCLVIFKNKY